MAIAVDIHRARREVIPADYGRMLALLDDLPATLAHFPALDNLVAVAPDHFHWHLAPIGPAAYRMPVDFATRFTIERTSGRLRFEPVKGIGNASIGGRIALSPEGTDATSLEMTIAGTVKVAVPWLLKTLAAPVVAREFNALVDGFVANLKSAHLDPEPLA
ncbi:hypothetical protein L2U69_18425 [Zavarzinia compransoris]|uniref:hypothetical protein n=1 Tax=Zavarzinia marina TaxID=2911065 RepID=UPI001F3C9AEA|nr:hypothetical protein [Zavarzinia marina]MCF4167628.1 hypothetical protein [Zavarzinia marina]